MYKNPGLMLAFHVLHQKRKVPEDDEIPERKIIIEEVKRRLTMAARKKLR